MTIQLEAALRVLGALHSDTRLLIKKVAVHFTSVRTVILDQGTRDCVFLFENRANLANYREIRVMMRNVIMNMYSSLLDEQLSEKPNTLLGGGKEGQKPKQQNGQKHSRRGVDGLVVTRDIALSEVTEKLADSVQTELPKSWLLCTSMTSSIFVRGLTAL